MNPIFKYALILYCVGSALIIGALSVAVYSLGQLGGYW